VTGPVRLSARTAGALRPAVARPDYNPTAQRIGIVHFGIGAFHRAHQTWYTDAAMSAGERDWAILGVSLRSPEVAGQLNPQNGLYTLTERSIDGWQTRLIGAVSGVCVASRDSAAIVAALAARTTHIVSFTVTEKGYCRLPDGNLDVEAAGQGSFYPLLATALGLRRAQGLPGLTLLSCDNLADNGGQLAHLMGDFLDRSDPGLRRWFEAECACPATMVDRIVPATTEADRNELAGLIGAVDQGAVMTEPFSQWVIEDRFAGPRPRWEAVGARLVDDVSPYETAKLRMLNGAHSLLAYGGLARGWTHVAQAVADPELRELAARLMREEAAPTIAAAPGQHLEGYAETLLERFANPTLEHRLIQIAMDGSQKLPQRWLETLAANQSQGRDCPAILTGIAAWLRHLGGANGPVMDPRAAELARAAGSAEPVDALFAPGGLLGSSWRPTAGQRAFILAAAGPIA
jgi:fructuronate reductase